jgi:hypothetical protein
MLYGGKIIFFNACNLGRVVAQLSPSKSDEGQELQATGFSGCWFAKLRHLKNNIQCVRVRSSVDLQFSHVPAGFSSYGKPDNSFVDR